MARVRFASRQIARVCQGHVIEALRRVQRHSCRTAVTSPPYWGHRNYNTDVQVWGGAEDCDHEFGLPEVGRRVRWGNTDTLSDKQSSNRGSRSMVAAIERPGGQICECGAWKGELGGEPTPELFVEHLVSVFREVRDCLTPDGTLWVNLGDGYSNKQLTGIPWMFAFAMKANGWYLRNDIIWEKPNAMPHPVKDKLLPSHEHIFLFSKQPKYYFDVYAILEPYAETTLPQKGTHYKGKATKDYDGAKAQNPGDSKRRMIASMEKNPGRRKRDVWRVCTANYKGAHFATYPPALIEPCILAGTSEKGGCVKCGKPWVRNIKQGANHKGRSDSGKYSEGAEFINATYFMPRGSDLKKKWREENPTVLLGWKPTCNCGAPPKPDTVLDPFSGSGTTGEVALKHGRSYIGCELNPDFIELQRKRLSPWPLESH